jgi:two-component system, OmpR family, KDP operon response regulator KdpE
MRAGRILAVDDEPQIRRVLRGTLSAAGYEVKEARTGEEALVAVREQRFDLILLDINMPGIGGLQTCREIRANSEIAIIMPSVRNGQQDKVAALDAGADDYITKPFGTPELLARMRAALRRLPTSLERSTELVHLPDLEIDLGMRRVVAKGQEVHLTPKEFDLLHCLLEHPNSSVPHGRLLQAVWGPEYGDEIEYLRVVMNRLRKKIEADPSNPRYLPTSPWIGYRFHLSQNSS